MNSPIVDSGSVSAWSQGLSFDVSRDILASTLKPRRDTKAPCHRQRTRHVAVFVDKASSYGRGLLEGVGAYLAGHGPWSLFVETRATGVLDAAWLNRWRGDGILGLILSQTSARRLRQRWIPTVETYAHAEGLSLPTVVTDHEAIGRLAAEHLLERHFEHFAYCGYEDEPWSDRRGRGFAEVVQSRSFECQRYLYPRRHRRLAAWELAQRRMAQWIKRLPTPMGILACSDRHAQRVLDACQRVGVSVPEQAAVVGVDNDEEFCGLSNPPLSSVQDDPRRVGFQAAELLDRLMADSRSSAPTKPILVPPLEVVTQRSSDITAISDPVIARAIRFIREHACEGIAIEDVHKAVSLSRSALYQRFKRVLNCTPHEQILRMKLDRIRHLITHTSWSMSRIAQHAGFDHAEYMTVLFKRETGLNPGEYRTRHTSRATAVSRRSYSSEPDRQKLRS